ncbi:hypothetical protein TVAG_356140 [Trichomonas vaginalis G3]|uniref:Uncharacterized protein n=1 Tax=Trichomonas vaginalis (strain ATCC PRA-98 / G3) TaxID=412133 RepID=A2GG14_TRIV3|nr:hypothetical protein TVAGG3_0626790 [Trichomonas vaginalis G3]EAX83903.1 hypothetical protein TVAG_356140 [Trichomonas vaginalis G3]KAI5504246.1 hypothetical protein TVAGG3_0626790 [Trichomonas vaginalis G3]|eukprot:XP_001296833.1 hypothetical protein [Trichomonas vaginalis G3]
MNKSHVPSAGIHVMKIGENVGEIIEFPIDKNVGDQDELVDHKEKSSPIEISKYAEFIDIDDKNKAVLVVKLLYNLETFQDAKDLINSLEKQSKNYESALQNKAEIWLEKYLPELMKEVKDARTARMRLKIIKK